MPVSDAEKLVETEQQLAGFLVKYRKMRHALMDARAYVSCDIFSKEPYGPEAAELYERLCLLEANTALEPTLVKAADAPDDLARAERAGRQAEALAKRLDQVVDAFDRRRTGFPLGHEEEIAIIETARAALAAYREGK